MHIPSGRKRNGNGERGGTPGMGRERRGRRNNGKELDDVRRAG